MSKYAHRKGGNTFKGLFDKLFGSHSDREVKRLLPLVDRSLVKSTEFFTEDQIMAFPFQSSSITPHNARNGAGAKQIDGNEYCSKSALAVIADRGGNMNKGTERISGVFVSCSCFSLSAENACSNINNWTFQSTTTPYIRRGRMIRWNE